MKTYKVWLAKNVLAMLVPQANLETLTETHEPHGLLEATDLEAAFAELQAGIGADHGHRSLSVGDVLEEGEDAYLVMPQGFQLLLPGQGVASESMLRDIVIAYSEDINDFEDEFEEGNDLDDFRCEFGYGEPDYEQASIRLETTTANLKEFQLFINESPTTETITEVEGGWELSSGGVFDSLAGAIVESFNRPNEALQPEANEPMPQTAQSGLDLPF